MATTALELFTDALVEIGSLGVGEVPNADDAFLCLREFNRMTGAWSTQREMLFTVGSQIFTLTAAKQSYLIGPGAVDFNVPRPILIQTAASILPGTSVRVPMDLFSSQQFAAIREKGLSGVLPDKLYCDYGTPVATINVHPVPVAPISIEVYSFGILQQIAGLTDVLQFPPGYENALKYNLAVKIRASFGMPANPDTNQQATLGKMEIMKINADLYRGALGTAVLFPLPNEGAPAPPVAPPQAAQ